MLVMISAASYALPEAEVHMTAPFLPRSSLVLAHQDIHILLADGIAKVARPLLHMTFIAVRHFPTTQIDLAIRYKDEAASTQPIPSAQVRRLRL